MPEGLIEDEMQGLTEDQAPGSGTVALATSTGYEPNLAQVNEETDTVQGQLTGILDRGGPLMDRAETRAKQQVNSRGLLNSSMAVQAGQSALYDAALPIASQDAATHSTQRLTNQATTNRAYEFGASAANTKSLANQAAKNAFGSQKLAGEIQTGLIGAQGEQTRLNIGAQTQGSMQLADLQADLNERMAQLQANLQTNQIMPAEFEQQKALLDKQSQIAEQMAQLQADLQTEQIMPAQFEQEMAKLQQALENAQTLSQQEFQQQSQLSAQSYSQTLGTMEFQQAHQQTMQNLQNQFAQSMAQLQADLETGQIVARLRCKLEIPRYADQLYWLGRAYNTALIVPERQGGYGEALIISLRDGTTGRPPYPKLYRHLERTRGKRPMQDEYGYPMTTKTRPECLEYLKSLVHNRLFQKLPAGTVSELGTFVYMDTNPSPRAQEGCHDDDVMSLALAAQAWRQGGHHPAPKGRRVGGKKQAYQPHPSRQTI